MKEVYEKELKENCTECGECIYSVEMDYSDYDFCAEFANSKLCKSNLKIKLLEEQNKQLLDALKGMIEMTDIVFGKINWGKTFLNAQAIQKMNEAPIISKQLIESMTGKKPEEL